MSASLDLCIVDHRVSPGYGQGAVNYEVARRALGQGHRVTILASAIADDLGAAPGLRFVRVGVGRWPTALARERLFSWKSARWLRRHRGRSLVLAVGCITSENADVCVAQFVHSTWAPRRARIEGSSGPYALYQALYTSLNAAWERPAFLGARAVVAVSEAVRADLLAMGVSAQAVRVIRNACDLEKYRPGPEDRARLGLPEGTLAFFAGDIATPRKNLDTVLRALARAPGLRLVVAGEKRRSPYPELAGRLGVADRVTFLGYRADVAALMRAVDLFVFPSRYETFGLVALEAMASGLPVITAATVGASELLTPDSGVVLADPEDEAGLAAALGRLGGDAALRREMGRAARAVAEAHGAEAMADAYLALFRELAS